MYIYSISGQFYEGMTWEDFLCIEGNGVLCTIRVEKTVSNDIQFDFESDGSGENEWYDAIVAPALTMETATHVLATINNCSLEEIKIVEQKCCLAI